MKLTIHLKPNSKIAPKVEQIGDGLVVYSRQPAVEGKANEDLIKILSNYYHTPKSNIKITRGLKSKTKIVEIIGGSTPHK